MNSDSQNYPCHCCKHLTLSESSGNTFEICPVCFWEDDEFQMKNPDFVGGANKVSLNQARLNYLEFGACELRFIKDVRKL